MPNSYDVFFSYSHSEPDKRFVRALTDELRTRGLRVWLDDSSVRVGDEFMTKISNALEHSRNFIVLISPDYLSSPWTSFELGVALGRKDDKAKLVPLFIRDVDQSLLPAFLKKLHGLNVEHLPIDAIAGQIEKVVKDEQTSSGGANV